VRRKNLAIGIDLGTTYSVAASWSNNAIGNRNIDVIPAKSYSNGLVRSMVCYEKDDTPSGVGLSAIELQLRNLKNTVYSAKRLIGRKFDDIAIEEDKKKLAI